VPAPDGDIDRLENEALARGWKGVVWHQPLPVTTEDEPDLAGWLEKIRNRIVPPFQKFAHQLGLLKNRPSGAELAGALRRLWQALQVEETLRDWSTQESGPEPIHLTVWEQMEAWLKNIELAFPTEAVQLADWLRPALATSPWASSRPRWIRS
jgi:hypothetical protein